MVLGSDGLFDVLPNKTISRVVGKMGSSAQKVCNELVKEANKKKVTSVVPSDLYYIGCDAPFISVQSGMFPKIRSRNGSGRTTSR